MSELKWGGQKVVRRSQSAPLATHSPHLLAHGEGGCDDHHGECDLEEKWKSLWITLSWTCILTKVIKAPTPLLVNGDGERRGITENVILKTLRIFIVRSQACVLNNWICLNHISLMTTSTATEYNERRSSESSTSSCCEAQLSADRPPSTISAVFRVRRTTYLRTALRTCSTLSFSTSRS